MKAMNTCMKCEAWDGSGECPLSDCILAIPEKEDDN